MQLERKRFYSKYRDIKRRCENKNFEAYKNYGGRGIRCEWKCFKEFLDDMFESFMEHCEKYGLDETTIDRIDNNGNYCKRNCRWATNKEQTRNRGITKKVIYYGEVYDLWDLCEINSLNYFMVWNRLKKGWRLEMAIGLPKVRNKNLFRK